MAQSFRPGQPAPRSGIVRIVGPRGGRTDQERTVVRGEPMPPTRRPGETFVYDRLTHNGDGDGR